MGWYPPPPGGGGVPAHYIMKTKDYADKCKENTPVYDLENYRKNFREEVNLICDRMEHSMWNKE